MGTQVRTRQPSGSVDVNASCVLGLPQSTAGFDIDTSNDKTWPASQVSLVTVSMVVLKVTVGATAAQYGVTPSTATVANWFAASNARTLTRRPVASSEKP